MDDPMDAGWDLGPHDPRHGDAADWYDAIGRANVADGVGITTDTTDDELAAIAARETSVAAAEDPPQIVAGIEDYLRDLRDALRGHDA